MTDEGVRSIHARRALRRRRRENVEGGRVSARHVVRVTPEEEARLLVMAGRAGVSVPRLLVESTFAAAGETASDRRELIEALFRIERLLAAVSRNVNQLAAASNAGLVPEDDVSKTLEMVRRTALRIEDVLGEIGQA